MMAGGRVMTTFFETRANLSSHKSLVELVGNEGNGITYEFNVY